ncbi:MAG: SUMF1/EgtB/PvdO family nonheme iron enzyme [Pirellulaceae bacterium]|nr:SUMF1/EgtB/PvdO family nonheme iron enzyme [Pirellulaceae bacterium]
MIRGGSWANDARNCRAANRNANEPANRNDNLGFRVAAAPSARGGYPAERNRPLSRPVNRRAKSEPGAAACW